MPSTTVLWNTRAPWAWSQLRERGAITSWVTPLCPDGPCSAYTVAQQQTQLPTMAPPPLADTARQTAYWSAPARKWIGYDQIGDWRNMAVIEAGWPHAGAGDGFITHTADVMLTALTQAVFQNADVGSVLADATEQLNAAAAQYAASATARR